MNMYMHGKRSAAYTLNTISVARLNTGLNTSKNIMAFALLDQIKMNALILAFALLSNSGDNRLHLVAEFETLQACEAARAKINAPIKTPSGIYTQIGYNFDNVCVSLR